jgi:hypothetical protein
MKPARKDFISRNDETLAAAVRLFNPDGTGFDLTVYTALRMCVRPGQFHPHAVIDLSLVAGLTTYASAGQSVVNTIDFKQAILTGNPDSISFLLGDYWYDVVGTRADGSREAVLSGLITFVQGQTYDLPS